jgi:hypothetical protein
MPKLFRQTVPLVSPLLIFCFLFIQFTAALPHEVRAEVQDELKQIEYKYYFRGKYNEAIEALRALLERQDLEPPVRREAREFLAASLILTGLNAEGKDEYLKILNQDASYAGPDSGVFQDEVIAVFNEAKVEYASMVIQRATAIETSREPAEAGPLPAEVAVEEKPFYKKWWFYTAIGAVVLVAAAAGAKEDDAPPAARDTGTVTVGIVVH